MPEVLLVNPRSRRRKKTTRKTSTRKRRTTASRTRRSSPRKRVSRYRRNPARRFNVQTFMQDTLMPSAVGAVGALGVDMVLGFVPLPANFKTGPLRPVVKGVAAVAIGMIANMVATRKTAEQITAGGLTVVLYDTAKTFVQQQFPALPLGMYETYPEMGYYSPVPIVESERYIENEGVGAYMDQSMGNIDLPLEGFDEELGAYMDQDAY